ncbi:hypothetical protein BBJ28_00016968 [Nothophytophthora sp. Chile5]|nr:hypothetical protein BBJ28_00016968 [Nothophytophthora sp. Chile5]
MMAMGPTGVYTFVSNKMTAAAPTHPHADLRLTNVSLSAQVPIADSTGREELYTVATALRNGVTGLFAKKPVGTKHILRNVSAVFEPGSMTLVLGQPGSGKSALLKVLGGRLPMEKNVHLEGEIQYGGTSRDILTRCLPQIVSYVPQQDTHFPTLTVQETLAFAHECCGAEELAERSAKRFIHGSPAENEAATAATRALFASYPQVVTYQLGLNACKDTIVGDVALRGVSGGEQKRVTTGEMQFGDKLVLLMDEISTGLDSAATFDIVSAQRSLAQTFQKTVVMALLQPSPEVYELFDSVLLLNDGEVMYHGPRADAESYFNGLGFVRPPGRDVAEFLVDMGTDQQDQYWISTVHNPPHSATAFAELFGRSAAHGALLNRLHAPSDKGETLAEWPPEFHQGFWNSTRTLASRQAKISRRNTLFLASRVVSVIVVGLLYGTLFWQFDPQDTQVVMGVTFASITFVAIGQMTEAPTFLAGREVFYKQRGANFFRTTSYVLAYALNMLPLAFLESILFGSIFYWACGFVPSATAFLCCLVLLFLSNLAFTASFFFITLASPNLNVAQPFGFLSILVYVLFAGFVVSKNQVPVYLIWIYWLNPMAWSVRSLAVVQYRDERFNTCVYNGLDYCAKYGMQMGEYSLALFDVPSDKAWIWLGMGYLVLTIVVFLALAYFVLEYRRYESPENVTVAASSDFFVGEGDATDFDILETPKPAIPVLALRVDSTQNRVVAPVTVAFRDLKYSVPDPKDPKQSIELLKGVSGYALPGTITALMGSSGAGKTTLMDVIAGRKTGGKIQGQILLNGYPATDLGMRRTTGYCEQMDIHSEASTFREALTFSAFLRQGADVPANSKLESVDECLELLGLDLIANRIIRGSSKEQLKRLTIGVELAAQPSMLFLDEPTSGLDAHVAKAIMDGVRKVADTGRTILCTIHQPSSEVFRVFDSMLLLKRGGETVFFGDLGERAVEMISYFESIEGVQKLPPGYNPATWVLEAIGAGVDNVNGSATTAANTTDFAAHFRCSALQQRLQEELSRDGLARPSPGLPPVDFGSKRAASNAVQMKMVVQRFVRLYWRTPSYTLTRFVVYAFVALIFGLLCVGSKYRTYQEVNSGLGMLFLMTIFTGVISLISVLPITIEQHASFHRERASQTYNAVWFFAGSTVAEVPYVASCALLFTAIFFPMVGFSGVPQFLLYWLNLTLHMLLQTYVGQFFGTLLPSADVAAAMALLFDSIFYVHMGFDPPASRIPKGYQWIYHITPQQYTMSTFVSAIFGDCSGPEDDAIGCQALMNAPPSLPDGISIESYVEQVFEMRRDDVARNLAVLLGYIVLFRALGLIALRYVNHSKR